MYVCLRFDASPKDQTSAHTHYPTNRTLQRHTELSYVCSTEDETPRTAVLTTSADLLAPMSFLTANARAGGRLRLVTRSNWRSSGQIRRRNRTSRAARGGMLKMNGVAVTSARSRSPRSGCVFADARGAVWSKSDGGVLAGLSGEATSALQL